MLNVWHLIVSRSSVSSKKTVAKSIVEMCCFKIFLKNHPDNIGNSPRMVFRYCSSFTFLLVFAIFCSAMNTGRVAKFLGV